MHTSDQGALLHVISQLSPLVFMHILHTYFIAADFLCFCESAVFFFKFQMHIIKCRNYSYRASFSTM